MKTDLPFRYSEAQSKFPNREAWLQACAAGLLPLFKDRQPPPFRVSLAPLRKSRLGQCHTDKQSEDRRHEIFISIELNDPMTIAATLAHEICHAVVGIKAGHKTPFKRMANRVLLEGKATATTPSEDFKREVAPLLEKLGALPHAAMDLSRGSEDKPKQGTRMIKVECEGCGYVVRTTQKWLDVGRPTCCCGGKMLADWDGAKPKEDDDE